MGSCALGNKANIIDVCKLGTKDSESGMKNKTNQFGLIKLIKVQTSENIENKSDKKDEHILKNTSQILKSKET